jgi:hypothetical protein
MTSDIFYLVVLLQEATRFGLVALVWNLIFFIYMTSTPYIKQVFFFDFFLPTYTISGCVHMIILYIAFVVRLVVYTHITLEYFYSLIFHSLYSWGYGALLFYICTPVYTLEGMEYFIFICPSLYSWGYGVIRFTLHSLYS